jgi:hypothetical protein
MASWSCHIVRQTGVGDEAAFVFLHSSILHLLVENIFLLLCSAAILLYCHFSLVAHLSIKIRGLVQDET